MTEMTMRMRVAQALCEKANGRFVSEYAWHGWLHYADAAIAAMRIYSKPMEDAYLVYAKDRRDTGNSPTVPGGWRVMINAALSEGTSHAHPAAATPGEAA